MDIRLALATGTDIPIPECQIAIHQPSIKEISYIGEQDFFIGVQTLAINKNMLIKDETVLETVNNFQIFMMVMNDKEASDKKRAVMQLFTLILPQYKVSLTPNSLILSKDKQTIMIDQNNFDNLQSIIKSAFCQSSKDNEDFNPVNDKAREIAAKLMRGRQRIAEIKAKDNNASVFGLYISILSIGLHIPVTVLSNYTMYQLYDEMERFSLWLNWDLDVKTRLAGGKPDSQPDNWMKPIH